MVRGSRIFSKVPRPRLHHRLHQAGSPPGAPLILAASRGQTWGKNIPEGPPARLRSARRVACWVIRRRSPGLLEGDGGSHHTVASGCPLPARSAEGSAIAPERKSLVRVQNHLPAAEGGGGGPAGYESEGGFRVKMGKLEADCTTHCTKNSLNGCLENRFSYMHPVRLSDLTRPSWGDP